MTRPRAPGISPFHRAVRTTYEPHSPTSHFTTLKRCAARRNSATDELGSPWAGQVTSAGPVVGVADFSIVALCEGDVVVAFTILDAGDGTPKLFGVYDTLFDACAVIPDWYAGDARFAACDSASAVATSPPDDGDVSATHVGPLHPAIRWNSSRAQSIGKLASVIRFRVERVEPKRCVSMENFGREFDRCSTAHWRSPASTPVGTTTSQPAELGQVRVSIPSLAHSKNLVASSSGVVISTTMRTSNHGIRHSRRRAST